MEKCVELSNFQFLDNTWTNFIRCCKSSHRQNFGLQNYPVTFNANKDHVIRWLMPKLSQLYCNLLLAMIPLLAMISQSCVKLIEYQKVYLQQYGRHFMNVGKIYLLQYLQAYDSAVHKTVHKFSAPRNTNMFALFGVSCARFAVTISPA